MTDQDAGGGFRKLVAGQELVAVVRADGIVREASPALEKLLGAHGGERGTSHLVDWLAPDDRERVERAFQALVEDPGGTARFRVDVRTADGEPRTLDVKGINALEDPEIEAVVLRGWDATELLGRQQEERRLLSLVEETPDLVALADADLNLLTLNRGGRRLMGWGPRVEVEGRSFLDLFTPASAERLRGYGIPAAIEDGSWSGETALLSEADDEEIPVWQVLTTHRGQDGELAFVSTWARDLSQQKLSMERIQFQADLLNAVGQAVIATDTDGRVIYWNRGAEALYGWTRDEARGRNILDLTPSETSTRQAAEIMAALEAGRPWTGEFAIRRKDGTVFPVRVTDSPILDQQGDLRGIIGISADISEERQFNAQVEQAQRLQAMGRLAGGVANDFNDILTAMAGHTELLMGSLGEDAPAREDASAVLQSVERASALTERLLAFNRRQVREIRTLDLVDQVREIEPMLRRLTPDEVELRVESDDGGWRVRADAGQLHQILLNLVMNAAQAVDGAGRITIRADHRLITRETAARMPWHVEPRRYARLVVEDTGAGMTPDVLEHALEPFFTTRSRTTAAGLGLATVYGIVKQSDGHIMLDSESGRGTRVEILLPAVDPELDEGDVRAGPRRTRRATVAPGEPATILLAENDDSVRDTTTRLLEDAGYRVLAAPNGREALSLAHEHEGTIHLVLCDVIMPEMGAREMLEGLRRSWPDVPVVITSGYGIEDLTGDFHRIVDGFLRKPYTSEPLLAAVRNALGD